MRTIEEVAKQYNHICWYPSAGSDFRALLFLTDWYYEKHNVPVEEGQVLPDLFIFTDLHGLRNWFEPAEYEIAEGVGHISYSSCVPETSILHASYKARYTDIYLKKIEELKSYRFSLDSDYNSERDQDYNSAYFLEVEVETKKYGTVKNYSARVLYISVQNEYFAKEFLIPNKICVEYQIIIRYGCGFGGAKEGPTWIIQSYKELGIRYLIANEEYVDSTECEATCKSCPTFKVIYSIDGKQWSGYGRVSWYRLI